MTTPEENVAFAERAYRTWAEEGIDGLRSLMHDEVEWHPPAQAPEPGPFRGPDEILRVAGSYMESFGEFMPVPERILPGAEPDQVVALVTLTTRGRESGAEFSIPAGHVLTIRDGRVLRFQVFTDQDEALRTAGLDPSG